MEGVLGKMLRLYSDYALMVIKHNYNTISQRIDKLIQSFSI